MCTFLLRAGRRNFSPIKLERALDIEVGKKIVGKPLTPETLPALAKYIEEMSRYIEQEDVKTERIRNEKVAKALRERAKRGPKQ
jgi:hypothetical protein